MALYHLNPVTGEYGPCHAQSPASCPFGGDNGENHYKTVTEAKAASEVWSKAQAFMQKNSLSKNKTKSTTVKEPGVSQERGRTPDSDFNGTKIIPGETQVYVLNHANGTKHKFYGPHTVTDLYQNEKGEYYVKVKGATLGGRNKKCPASEVVVSNKYGMSSVDVGDSVLWIGPSELSSHGEIHRNGEVVKKTNDSVVILDRNTGKKIRLSTNADKDMNRGITIGFRLIKDTSGDTSGLDGSMGMELPHERKEGIDAVVDYIKRPRGIWYRGTSTTEFMRDAGLYRFEDIDQAINDIPSTNNFVSRFNELLRKPHGRFGEEDSLGTHVYFDGYGQCADENGDMYFLKVVRNDNKKERKLYCDDISYKQGNEAVLTRNGNLTKDVLAKAVKGDEVIPMSWSEAGEFLQQMPALSGEHFKDDLGQRWRGAKWNRFVDNFMSRAEWHDDPSFGGHAYFSRDGLYKACQALALTEGDEYKVLDGTTADRLKRKAQSDIDWTLMNNGL